MTPISERWERARRLFDEARTLPVEQRASFLESACPCSFDGSWGGRARGGAVGFGWRLPRNAHRRVIAYSRRYNHPNRNAPVGDHSPMVEMLFRNNVAEWGELAVSPETYPKLDYERLGTLPLRTPCSTGPGDGRPQPW